MSEQPRSSARARKAPDNYRAGQEGNTIGLGTPRRATGPTASAMAAFWFKRHLKAAGWTYGNGGLQDFCFYPADLLLRHSQVYIREYGTLGVHYAKDWIGLYEMVYKYGTVREYALDDDDWDEKFNLYIDKDFHIPALAVNLDKVVILLDICDEEEDEGGDHKPAARPSGSSRKRKTEVLDNSNVAIKTETDNGNTKAKKSSNRNNVAIKTEGGEEEEDDRKPAARTTPPSVSHIAATVPAGRQTSRVPPSVSQARRDPPPIDMAVPTVATQPVTPAVHTLTSYLDAVSNGYEQLSVEEKKHFKTYVQGLLVGDR